MEFKTVCVTEQFKLRIPDELIAALVTAARNHNRRSAQQVAEEIIQTYLPFWEQAEQVKKNRVSQQREALFGSVGSEVEAERGKPFKRGGSRRVKK